MRLDPRTVDYALLARQIVPEPPRPDLTRQLSLVRILEAQVAPGGKCVGGLEGEVHAELQRQHGAESELHGGTLIPLGDFATRDQTVGTLSEGGYLVGAAGPVPTIAASLRAKSYVMQAGAQVMVMDKASTGIPVAAGLTGTWQATETTAVSAANVTFTNQAVSPKMLTLNVKASRRVMQMAPLLERFLYTEMGRGLAQAIDAAVLNGSGASGQPLGIIGTAGIGGFTGTSLNAAGVLNAERDVIDAGALYNESARAFFSNGAVGELLKGRLRTGNGSRYVADYDTGALRIGAIPLFETANMPASTVLYGDFSSVTVCIWPTLELLVNKYKVSSAGTYEIIVWAAVDVAVVHPESFSLATTVT